MLMRDMSTNVRSEVARVLGLFTDVDPVCCVVAETFSDIISNIIFAVVILLKNYRSRRSNKRVPQQYDLLKCDNHRSI